MRSSVALAVACLAFVGLTLADGSEASIKRLTNIPAQALGTALQTLAKERKFQIVYAYDELQNLRTAGATGELSSTEALEQLLRDTGLTYKYVDDQTVTIVPVNGRSASAASGAASGGLVESDLITRSPVSGLQLAQSESMKKVESTDSSESKKPDSSTEESGSKIQEIVVTAQKREERLQDVPISISVLDGEQLDRGTYTGINDALRSLPSIDINSLDTNAGGVLLSARGVSNGTSRAGGAGPIAYYIDGVPFGFVRHALYPSAGNLYDLERLEFLAGPQGTLYGANALNGVLRILTHNADPSAFAFKARTNFSSTERGGENYRGDVSLNVPLIHDKLAVRAIAGYRNDSGWIDGRLGNNLNDAEEKNYRLKLRAQPTETLAIDLSAWRSRGDDNGAASAPVGQANGQFRYVAYNAEPHSQEFDVYSANLQKDFSAFSLTSTSSYIDYSALGRIDVSPTSALALDTGLKSRVFSQEINFVSTLERAWRWSAGAFYRDAKDETDQLLYFLPTPDFNISQATTASNNEYTDTSESTAVYGEVARKFLDSKLELSLGLRYFREEQQTRLDKNYGSGASLLVAGTTYDSTSDAVTPRAVLTWKTSKDSMTYVSYSRGFRSGFAQQPNVQVAYPNFTPVNPDKLTNYEIGIKGSLMDGRFVYSAAAYYIDWKGIQQNLSVQVPNLPTFTTATVNGAAAHGPGFEFAFESRPFRGLSLGLNFSWNELKYDGNVISGTTVVARDGDRLGFNPEYTLGLSSEYSFPIGRSGFIGQLALSGNYKRPQLLYFLSSGNLTTNTGDDILIAASSLSIESPGRHWAASLYVNNLSDEQGTTNPVAPGGTGNEPRNVPRTIGIQLQYNY